jgi:hypothetical protein
MLRNLEKARATRGMLESEPEKEKVVTREATDKRKKKQKDEDYLYHLLLTTLSTLSLASYVSSRCRLAADVDWPPALPSSMSPSLLQHWRH